MSDVYGCGAKQIMVFSPAKDLSGGNYRLLRVLEHFPKENYIFAMPKNRKKYVKNF
jgi:hypothetical protein